MAMLAAPIRVPLRRRVREPVDAERRGTFEANQALSPVAARALAVLPLQPLDVVAERRRLRQLQLLPAAPGRVAREHLVRDDRRRPAVEQQMVARPNDPALGLGRAD